MSVRVDTDKIKKAIIFILPCLLFFWIGDKVCCAYRTVGISGNISVKAMPFFTNLGNALTNPLPSLHPLDAFVGFMTAVIAKLVLEYKRKHRKNMPRTRSTVQLVGVLPRILSRIWTGRISITMCFSRKPNALRWVSHQMSSMHEIRMYLLSAVQVRVKHAFMSSRILCKCTQAML